MPRNSGNSNRAAGQLLMWKLVVRFMYLVIVYIISTDPKTLPMHLAHDLRNDLDRLLSTL